MILPPSQIFDVLIFLYNLLHPQIFVIRFFCYNFDHLSHSKIIILTKVQFII
jgi:hypothetical protein